MGDHVPRFLIMFLFGQVWGNLLGKDGKEPSAKQAFVTGLVSVRSRAACADIARRTCQHQPNDRRGRKPRVCGCNHWKLGDGEGPVH